MTAVELTIINLLRTMPHLTWPWVIYYNVAKYIVFICCSVILRFSATQLLFSSELFSNALHVDQNGHTYPLVALSDTVLHTSYSHCTLKMQIKRITIFIFRINYIGTLKTVFSNKAFVIMFFVLGGNMSFISTLATKMEQIMCRYDVW